MPITPPPPPPTRLSLLKGFLAILLPLCSLLVFASMMHYYTLYETERVSRKASETLNVGLARRMIATDISAVVRDLAFLANHIERQNLFLIDAEERRRLIALEFRAFAEKKVLYDQIRFLDVNGMEVVRVNYADGQSVLVPQHELQNKSSRYYFREAFTLKRDNIYLSPLDLNVEAGRIEYPLKPMMRFATPLFDLQGRKKGVVVLNYFGERLIENFKLAAANIADHIELVNSEGYWLSSPNPDDEWGFMLGNDKQMPKRYPKVWHSIIGQESGQLERVEGLFTFATINPTQIAQQTADPDNQVNNPLAGTDAFWKIISRVPPHQLTTPLSEFIQVHAALYASMLLLILIGAWLLAATRLRHRRAEEQRAYEQRFRHTLENIELAALALDRQGSVRFCNDYFLRLTKWRREEMVGETWLDRCIPPEAREETGKILSRMETPESFPLQFETAVMTRDDQIRLINWNSTLTYDPNDRVIGVTLLGEDITDQRHAEEELRKLSRAVDQSPSIVMITDVEGVIEYVNPKFCEVTGYRPEEVVGLRPNILKSGEKSAEEYAELWQTIRKGLEWRGEFHNKNKNGQLYWESASISGIRGPDGKVAHFLAVKEDISERKRLEAEVAAHNRELARTQALTAMGRMASMIAHDLRNPLSSVKMTLQILGKQQNTGYNEKSEELRKISLEQIRYMEDILSDMLTYSRPDALKPEWLTIEKVMDLAVGLAQRKLDELGVELIIQHQPGLPTFHGDATKLRQVFSNLLINAAQAAENETTPEVVVETMVELGPSGTGIRIDISDNGCGIDPADQEKLFEPFFTTRAQGTGLGLAIVKRMLDQHNASISIRRNHPSGTCVSVVLPTTPQILPAGETAMEISNS